MLACYLRLIRAGFRRYSTYRQAVVAGLVTNIVFGFMRCAVLLTVFAGSAQVAGYNPSTTVTFVWIGQALVAVVAAGAAALAWRAGVRHYVGTGS